MRRSCKRLLPYLPNTLTVLRLFGAAALLFLEPMRPAFLLLYLLCGASDVLDGLLARALHLESPLGAALDSLADAVFLAVCAGKLLPALRLPPWAWLWGGGIAALKVASFCLHRKKRGRPEALHSRGNRLVGLLLFLSPFFSLLVDRAVLAALLGCAATWAALCEYRRVRGA